MRAGEECLLIRDLDDLSEIHDGDAVADTLDDCEVVGDEQIGKPELALQVAQQVDHLGLHRDLRRCPPEDLCGARSGASARKPTVRACLLARAASNRPRASPEWTS